MNPGEAGFKDPLRFVVEDEVEVVLILHRRSEFGRRVVHEVSKVLSPVIVPVVGMGVEIVIVKGGPVHRGLEEAEGIFPPLHDADEGEPMHAGDGVIDVEIGIVDGGISIVAKGHLGLNVPCFRVLGIGSQSFVGG